MEIPNQNIQKQNVQYKSEKQGFNFYFKSICKQFGPGMLISMAYLDPGNLAGDIEAGVSGEYSLLWSLFLSTLFGVFFQNYALQLGMVTQKDLAQLCKEKYSYNSKILLWIMAEIAIIGSDIQEVLGTAIALQIIFKIPMWLGVILTIVNTLLLLLLKNSSMKKFEILFTALVCVMTLCFFINLGYIKPSLYHMTYGTFVPSVPKESFVPLVGLVGSILMPHNLYLHSSLMNEPEKQVDTSDEKNFKQLLKFRKIETGLSLLLSFFINLCVISTFAYYSKKGKELDLLTAGEALESSFGDFSKLIWGIGLLASGQSSTLTSTLSGQYIIEGYIDFKMSKFKRAVLTRLVAIIPSLIIAFLQDVSTFNNYLNVLQAIQLPFAIIPLLKLCYDEDIMGQYKMTQFWFYLLSGVSILIVGVNYYTSIPMLLDVSYIFKAIIIIIGIMYFAFMFIITITDFKESNLNIQSKKIPYQYQNQNIQSQQQKQNIAKILNKNYDQFQDECSVENKEQ